MILKMTGVSKAYGSREVLKPLSFGVEQGERICILGPSGCGKSTLLQIAAGLVPADGGEVEMAGTVVERGSIRVPPEKRPINMVFQDYALWPHLTVKQNIEYGMKRRKLDPGERGRRLERLRDMLKLGDLLDRLPSQLSGGQQQRVGIARALATEPKLLLLDEPLSNLDVKLRTDMRGELARLLGDLNTAALYVTHDRMEAFAIADRILVLREGTIDQLGKPDDLFERPASPWVAQLMGYHNRLSVALPSGGDPVADVAGARVIGHRMTSPGRAGNGVMMVHPEAIAVHTDRESAGTNVLPAKVAQSIYEGTRWRIVAETADGQPLHLFHDGRVEPGSDVALRLAPERTMLYGEPVLGADG
ncbi:ABC transporter ATP-binding protein [Paenibacillaceae bacterium WGS1546]|uniref:ABC transporter ATP-binding protein n=1 Tax=Cohnella sp. WGS1546 TaxID=3366810 RepID=UPI00372D1317